MKLRIYEPPPTEEPQVEPEKEIYLRLVMLGVRIKLIACNKYGEKLARGYLMSFSEKGFYRLGCVSTKIGLPLDGNGRLKENKKDD